MNPNHNLYTETAPPGRTPNVYVPAQLNEVRGLTLDNLPPNVDRFLQPHDAPVPGDNHVYVVWRGHRVGLYHSW